MQTERVIEKIKRLPPERLREVEAFVDFLAARESSAGALHAEIAAYAAEYGGSGADLDPELEEAAIEHLRSIVEDEP
jgi:hypothetical protein